MTQATAEKVEIVRELTRGDGGISFEDIAKMTGWPNELLKEICQLIENNKTVSDFRKKQN